MHRAFFLILLGLLGACGPATLVDLRVQGEAETRKLAQELQQIESKDDLQRALPRLKKRFCKMAELIVEARKYGSEKGEANEASEQLFFEMARLYEIAGCKELIESAQQEAVQICR